MRQSDVTAADSHLLKVDVDGVVQDALTVSFIHHDQSVHLAKSQTQLQSILQ